MSEPRPKDIPHKVGDLVISCSDHRFQSVTAQKLLAEHGLDVNHTDRIIYPGASKAVADGALIPAIQILERLHNINKIWIVDHTDCGGFGGLQAFGNDEQKEIAGHARSIGRAKKAIANILPNVEIVSFVVDLEGNLIGK